MAQTTDKIRHGAVMQVDGNALIGAYFKEIQDVGPFLKAYGHASPPTYEMLRKWKTRGVPSGWLPDIMVCLEVEYGKPVSLAPYIRD